MPTTREVAAKKAERQRREQASRERLDSDVDVEPGHAPKKDDLPAWAGEDLVYCADGPRSGSWYLLSEGASSWLELRRLALGHGETEHTGRTLGYVPLSDEWETHPRWPLLRGRVLIWAPDVAASVADSKVAAR